MHWCGFVRRGCDASRRVGDTASGVAVDIERRVNRRLVDLGYSRSDAHAEPSRDGVRLTGDLLGEADLDRRSVEPVVGMLPSKLRLLAMRLALRRRGGG